MSVFTVKVTLRHQDTFREVSTVVSVMEDFDRPWDALTLALQMAVTHRLGYMPIDGRIVAVAP